MAASTAETEACIARAQAALALGHFVGLLPVGTYLTSGEPLTISPSFGVSLPDLSAPDTSCPQPTGHVLGTLGDVHADQGRLDDACICYESSILIAREIGNRMGEGVVLCSLGGLHHDRGRPDESRVCFEAALVLARGE